MRTVGPYRLRGLLGRGASSEVHAADGPDGEVAVKLLRPELAEDVAQTQALLEEGMRLRAIDHPNVVRMLDARIDTAGCYLVMERVRGETLAALLRRAGRLPEAEVRRLGAELADGVAAAHARGIVHRDLKPANVMFDGARPKVVDFGIAKHLGARSAVTTARMIGTLAYMAPEQLSSGMIAPCTDLWALGVILFEALAGRLPFDDFADGRCAQLFDEPARAAAVVPVSPELDAIIARCLSREPARRPSADELAALLRGERALDDERITADAGPLPVVASGRPPNPASVHAGVPVAARAERGDGGTSPAGADAARPRSRARIALWLVGGLAAVATGVSLAAAVRCGSDPTPAIPTAAAEAARSVARPGAPGSDHGAIEAAHLEAARKAAIEPPHEPIEAAQLEPARKAIESPHEPIEAAQHGPARRAIEPPQLELAPVPVEVRTRPGGAQVLVDGRLRGVTPLTIEVELPEVLVIRRAGYHSVQQRVDRAGLVDVALRPVVPRPPPPPKKTPRPGEPLD